MLSISQVYSTLVFSRFLRLITVKPACPDTGRASLAALSPFRTEMLEARDGHCEIAVLLGRDDSEVVAVLNSLEHYVTERDTGPARVDFNGRSYVMYAGPGDLTE